MEKVYSIKNLNCAHCASKIEEKIKNMDGIHSADIIFASKKLKVNGNINSHTLSKINSIAHKIEPDVEFIEETENLGEAFLLRGKIASLLVGAALYLAAMLSQKFMDNFILYLCLYIAAYLVFGCEVLAATFKNIRKGNVFNENFLMTIATLGAFFLREYSEAVGVMLFFKIGEIFEQYAVAGSRKAISAAASLKVNEADILRDGKFIHCSSDEISKGDVIRVSAGERIAADGIITGGETRLDTSAINGEPIPKSVTVGDKAISGCINLGDVITVTATAPAADSMISKIADAVENASASKPKIDRFITRFAKFYTPIVIAAAAIIAVIPSLVCGNWIEWLYTALTLLVISCPCAIVLSVPLAYFSGIGAASKLGILFKGGSSLEALGKVKAVAFDKTGTVTTGTFDVTLIEPSDGISKKELLEICGSCESSSKHPVAESITRYCRHNNIAIAVPEKTKEISGKGIISLIVGKAVICGNKRIMDEHGIAVPDNSDRSGSVVYVASEKQYLGRIIVSDSIKKNSAEAVAQMKKMGLHTAMLTGDKTENAEIVAKEINADYVKSELFPEDKLEEIKNIRNKYGAVMFIGDGINDGPVLAGADVGAAMQDGSDLALEAADAVFINQELDSAVNAKKIADKTLRVSMENIVFALVFKLAVLILGMLGHASMWFAVFADSGVAMLLILNSIRILRTGVKRR